MALSSVGPSGELQNVLKSSTVGLVNGRPGVSVLDKEHLSLSKYLIYIFGNK